MTEVVIGDDKIVTDLPAEAVADLQAPKEPEAEPAKPAEAETPPVAPKTEEPKTEPEKVKVEEPKEQPDTKVERQPKKATPFQTLLEKKHEAEQRAEKAEKALQQHLQKAGEQSTPVTTSDVAEILEKYGVDDANKALFNDLVVAIRAGIKPELPKEVQDLIAKQQQTEQEKAEQQAFIADYSRLQSALGDELLKKPEVREKLMELAYSDKPAPDGEPYFKKPLFELYHKFVKPEVEPGKPSAEPSQGGSKAGTDVVDFEEIHNDETKLMEFLDKEPLGSPQYQAYIKWRDERTPDVPIRHART